MKTKREIMLDQHCCCAFCGRVFSAIETPRFHKRSNTMVCKTCSPLVVQLVPAVERFGNPEAFVDHFAAFVRTAGLGAPDTAYIDELANSAARAMLETDTAKEQP